jgi:hypothetical protein
MSLNTDALYKYVISNPVFQKWLLPEDLVMETYEGHGDNVSFMGLLNLSTRLGYWSVSRFGHLTPRYELDRRLCWPMSNCGLSNTAKTEVPKPLLGYELDRQPIVSRLTNMATLLTFTWYPADAIRRWLGTADKKKRGRNGGIPPDYSLDAYVLSAL